MSFTCLHCLRVQPDTDICSDCHGDMEPGSLCRCGERIAATGADECVSCLADEVRQDPDALQGMYSTLRDKVLAHLRKGAEPTYSEGCILRRQAGAR